MNKRIAIITTALVAAVVLTWLFLLPASEYAPPDDGLTPPVGTDTLEDVPPPVDPRPSSEDEDSSMLTQVDRILSTLEEAKAAFDTPSAMRWGETRTMTLLLSPAAAAESLAQRLDDPAESDTARVRVGHRMRATLSGAGFNVEPITPELQAVSYSDITEWKWDVEPTRTGRQALHLSLSALIDVGDETMSRSIRTFSRDIEVDVTMRQLVATFVSENWQWLWAAILVPIASWAWARVRARKRATERGEADS